LAPGTASAGKQQSRELKLVQEIDELAEGHPLRAHVGSGSPRPANALIPDPELSDVLAAVISNADQDAFWFTGTVGMSSTLTFMTELPP